MDSLFLPAEKINMSIVNNIRELTAEAIKEVFHFEADSSAVAVNATKPEFEGDYTVVLFSLIKQLKKSPEVAGNELGNFLLKQYPHIFSAFNVIKGFLNLLIAE